MGLTEHSFLERMELMGLTESKAVTNADRIRSLTDVELAKYLCKLIREGVMMAIPSAHYSNADIEELNQNWLDWLRQEVDDEN